MLGQFHICIEWILVIFTLVHPSYPFHPSTKAFFLSNKPIPCFRVCFSWAWPAESRIAWVGCYLLEYRPLVSGFSTEENDSPSWNNHQLLIVPRGRGGAAWSLLHPWQNLDGQDPILCTCCAAQHGFNGVQEWWIYYVQWMYFSCVFFYTLAHTFFLFTISEHSLSFGVCGVDTTLESMTSASRILGILASYWFLH